ncbi:MAG: UDP-N-acetylmuramoyl-tripeptide--D-alanyl-D-alanine ligase [Phycisphaerae bacterium]|nr:UDP-N-acetylmuramoyl-tripeptide--D-alanyl-D-alanine ligase [Phycisphaerae bacterium]
MIQTTLHNIITVLDAKCSRTVSAEAQIRGVSIDSRAMVPGQAFIAVKGDRFDGHDFAAAVAQQGAACLIVERDIAMPSDNNVPVLKVRNTLEALTHLARWYRSQLSAHVIAVTGSAGKTTVRSILHHVLSRSSRCHQAVKSYNNHIGVPLTILDAPDDCEILLMELGTNHPGEIEPLARIANPDTACITLIGPAHLEGFGSIENILIEKASIATGLKPGGTLYINGDQPMLVAYAASLGVRVITFGTTDKCDVIGTSLRTDGLTGSLIVEGRRIDVPLPGKANLMNVLTVWSICRDLKVGLSDFIDAIASLPPVPMRLTAETVGQITLLNDCYNANPASMANALDTLSQLERQTNRRAVFVAGSMGELGPTAPQLHRMVGRQAAEANVACLLACGPFASDIVVGAKEAGFDGLSHLFKNTAELCDTLHSFVRPADIVLVKGSRAAGLEAAVEVLRKTKARQRELPDNK